MTNGTALHFASLNDIGTAGAAGVGATLISATVNTGGTSAVLTIYNGTSTSGAVVATIDASTKGSFYFGGARLPNGIYAKLTGGTADCTVVYS